MSKNKIPPAIKLTIGGRGSPQRRYWLEHADQALWRTAVLAWSGSVSQPLRVCRHACRENHRQPRSQARHHVLRWASELDYADGDPAVYPVDQRFQQEDSTTTLTWSSSMPSGITSSGFTRHCGRARRWQQGSKPRQADRAARGSQIGWCAARRMTLLQFKLRHYRQPTLFDFDP